MYYTAVRLRLLVVVSLANSHAVNYCGELAKETRRVGESETRDHRAHVWCQRDIPAYAWPRLVANLQQKHQLTNRMKGRHAAALACLALAHAIAPPGGEALVDGEIATGRERDRHGNFFDGGPCIKKSLRKGNLGARRRRDCKRPTWQLLRRRPVHERADEMQRRSVLSDRLVALRARIYELSNSRWRSRPPARSSTCC